MAKKNAAEQGGLTVRTFGGLNKKRYAKKAGGGADRVVLQQGQTGTFQFVADIDDASQWKEIEQHQFQDGGKWNYVPCLGDNCPLCEDDDADVKKSHYRFFTTVWDFKEKKYAVLEGPKDLSGRIAFRRERAEKTKKGKFLKTTWDISKMSTTPVSYDVERGDEEAIKIDPKKLINLDQYIISAAKRYFGDDLPSDGGKAKSALDDDEYDEDEDEYDADDLEEMSPPEIKRIAKSLGVKLTDKDGNKRSKRALIKLILKKQ